MRDEQPLEAGIAPKGSFKKIWRRSTLPNESIEALYHRTLRAHRLKSGLPCSGRIIWVFPVERFVQIKRALTVGVTIRAL